MQRRARKEGGRAETMFEAGSRTGTTVDGEFRKIDLKFRLLTSSCSLSLKLIRRGGGADCHAQHRHK